MNRTKSPASPTQPQSQSPNNDATEMSALNMPASPDAAPAQSIMDIIKQNTVLASAVGQFAVASIAMMVGNKAAVQALPLPCLVVIIQVIGTLGLLFLYKSEIQPLSMVTAKKWLPIATLFTSMLFTSLQAFVYVGVSEVIIYRNIGAIVTTVVEYFVRGVTVNKRILASEAAIVIGAIIYGYYSVKFSVVGFVWVMINVGCQVAYGVTMKKLTDLNPELQELSKYTMSTYNNLLALPMIIFVFFFQGEYETAAIRFGETTGWGWFIIGVTCFFGFLISTSGFGLQKLVSATTFLVINNLTKFGNIGIGMAFLNDTVASNTQLSGLMVAMLAGAWYSYESIRHAEYLKQLRAQQASQ